ncbi:MAG: DNA-3-methyladenine glycosylase I [Deltaproteobacteria bacterium]|nr:DNA-3-methyladenine glycosylase I [Deltaproteobacteria bacterium]
MVEETIVRRCTWCGSDPQYIAYHDEDWGVPVYDDRLLFEMLILEGAQAGLSWLTILKKRDNYRKAFHDFDADRIARYDQQEIDRLMQDAGIVRNRLKIEAAVKNARGFLQVREESSSFSDYLWRYVDGKQIVNEWKELSDIPAHTKISNQLSKDLKKRGFNFIGPTICYAFMQSIGMVNDHTTDCFRYHEINQLTSKRESP